MKRVLAILLACGVFAAMTVNMLLLERRVRQLEKPAKEEDERVGQQIERVNGHGIRLASLEADMRKVAEVIEFDGKLFVKQDRVNKEAAATLVFLEKRQDLHEKTLKKLLDTLDKLFAEVQKALPADKKEK